MARPHSTDGRNMLQPDSVEIRRFLKAHMHNGEVFEVRVPKPKQRRGTLVGYYTDPEALTRDIAQMHGAVAEGVYITINAVNPALQARASNRLASGTSASQDRDIPCLTSLLIDVDAKRPAGISATADERAAAHAVRDQIQCFLTEEMGWPEPAAIIDSGNGGHLHYTLNLANDAESVSVLRSTLEGLAHLFNTEAVNVDTTVSNPARIARIPGTIAAKGDSTEDRPWRVASGHYNPERPIVTREQLQAVAAVAPIQPANARNNVSRPNAIRTWNIRNVLRDSGIGYREKPRDYGTVFVLDRCLTSSDHDNGAVIIELSSGALAYRCQHNRCGHKTWDDVRPLLTIPQSERELIEESQNGHDGDATVPPHRTPSDPIGPRLIVTPMSAIEPKPIDWLWEGWLASKKIHILGGHPGDGKSTLTAWLAAELSKGGRLPDGQRVRPRNSLFLLAEDALDDTLRPRLDLHNADVSRIFAIQAVEDGDGKQRVFNLARHLEEARAAIIEHYIDLWVIDPLTAFMAKSDRNAEGDVRDLLTPVAKLAEETGVAVLCVMHLSKPGGTQRRTLQHLLGATAFGATGRVVWMVSDTGDDESPPRRVLGVVKSNIGPKPPPLEWSREIDGPVQWHGESSYDLDALMAGESGSKLDEAEAFLFETLKGGSVPSETVKAQARKLRISNATLRRAKDALEIKAYRQPRQKNGPWLWTLPTESPVGEAAEEDAQAHIHEDEHLPFSEDAQAREMSTFADSSGNWHIPGAEERSTGEDAHLSRLPNEHLPHLPQSDARRPVEWF